MSVEWAIRYSALYQSFELSQGISNSKETVIRPRVDPEVERVLREIGIEQWTELMAGQNVTYEVLKTMPYNGMRPDGMACASLLFGVTEYVMKSVNFVKSLAGDSIAS
jgi:hypothetical protein